MVISGVAGKAGQGHRSTGNSTATPLLASTTFTGTAEGALGYGHLAITAYVEPANCPGTLWVDFSSDGGSNWDRSRSASMDYPQEQHVMFAAVEGSTYRVRYVNGSTAQTTFRLETIGYGGPMPMDDPLHAISSGQVIGVSHVNKFGWNVDCDGTETIWSGGGVLSYPTAARVHNLASTSDEDGAGTSTGMLTVLVQGLDGNWDLLSEIVTLNGTTNAPTANAYWRIFRMKGLTFGSADTNVGTITATAVTDATVSAEVPIGHGQTGMAAYTVPDGKQGYIPNYYASMNKSGLATNNAVLRLEVRDNADLATAGWRTIRRIGITSGGGNPFDLPIVPYEQKLRARTDIRITCQEVSASDIDISAGFDLVLEDVP